MKLAGGVRVELVGDFSSLLFVIVSCTGNDIVVAKCGILGGCVASTFGCQFMMPIFIFNSFRPLTYLSFSILLVE